MNKIKSLALLMTLIISLPQLGVLVYAQVIPELYVSPSSGYGIDEEPVIVSGCYFRPNSLISKISLYNTVTGQTYEFLVNEPTDESGCFGPIDLKTYLMTNMSYGTYYVIVYETPVEQPEPFVVTDTVAFNESSSLIVDASVLGTPATITAEFYVEGFFGFNGHTYAYSSDVTTTIGVLFTGEDEKAYRLNAWRVDVTRVDSPVMFQLIDMETNSVVFSEEVVPEEVDGVFVATLTFDLGGRLREDLPNNMALFTSAEDFIRLDLYYGGRHVEVLYALLSITYYNEETDTYWEYLYEYPGNLLVDPETGIVYVEQYLGIDADIEWSSIFEWDAISEDVIFVVYATYLSRTLYFLEDLYTVTPLLYINDMPAENGETYDFGVLTAGHTFELTIYGSAPYSPVTVIVDGTLTLYNGLTGKDGNSSFTIQVPYLMPGEEHLITIEFQYDTNVYRVYVIYTQYWYAYYQILNPVTGEYLPVNKASASYYNETLIAYLDGEPFDYLGDVIEVYAEGLLPGADVVLKLDGYSDFGVCSGRASENGVLSLVCTIPSVPRDNYVVKLAVTDDIEVSIPWFDGSEYVYEPLEIYPKILVLRVSSDEIPVVFGNTVVRVVGTGFPAYLSGFLVLLNGTDALASVNLHTGIWWGTNKYGILVNVLGATPGLTIPVLEPGVYELRLAGNDVVSEPGYVFIVNELNNVATKEDINNLISNTTDLVNGLREDIYNVRDSLATQLAGIEAQLMSIETSLASVQDILTSIYSEMVTKEDLMTALNTVLSEINSSKMELLTTLLEQFSLISSNIDGLYVRLDEIEAVIYDVSDNIINELLILQEGLNETLQKLDIILEDMVTTEDLAAVYEGLSTLIESVHDSIISRVNELESNIINRIGEAESNLIAGMETLRSDVLEAISGVNYTIVSKIESVHDSIISRVNELESSLTNEMSLLRGEISSSTAELAGLVNESTSMVMNKLNELTTKNDLLNAVEDLSTRIDGVESNILDKVDSLGNMLLDVNTTLSESISVVESRIVSVEDKITELEKSVSELSEIISGIGVDLAGVNENLSSKIDELESSISEKITQAKNEVKTSFSDSLAIVEERVEGATGVASNAFMFSLLSAVFAIIATVVAIVILVQLRRF
ncbi:MAG: hypothetical protein QXM79_04390 [Zestosphaera sp.]